MKINNINQNLMNMAKTSSEKAKSSNFEEKLKEASKKQDDEGLKEACQQFEAYFIKKVFSEMRNSNNVEGYINESRSEEIFTDMLDDEYSKEISKSDGIGIAKMMYDQMKKDVKAN